MPASLLSPDSPASNRSRELLDRFPELTDVPGLPQARIVNEYILGRRSGELDVSGRPTDGTFIAAEAVAALPHDIIVVDDAQGLQAKLLGELALVTTYNDRIDEARIVAEAAPSAVPSADWASLRSSEDPDRETWAIVNAPKATQALAETITALHAHVTTVIVIGRSDSMSRAVNKELARGFARVDVSPGVGKHRMIIGSRRLSSPSLPSFPKHNTIDHPATGQLEVRAHGACFSGTKNDEGSALLLTAVSTETAAGTETAVSTETAAGTETVVGAARDDDQSTPAPESILDLGCGNGWLLTAAMSVTKAAHGVGVDVSKAAVASAAETAAANDIEVDVVLADATDTEALVDILASADIDGSAGSGGFDLILLNPPFHQGTTIETDTAAALMETAAALLAPGGQVLTVFNSHLRYRESLQTHIGPSEQVARTSKFTVVRSRTA